MYDVRMQRLLLWLPALTLSVYSQSLDGVIDLHAHAAPDGTRRSIDAIDLARLAKSRGMRAIVLKSHKESTAGLAYLVRKEVPGIEVFGGIGLDLEAGGLNAAAVDWMTKMTGGYGRVVWLPTFDAEAQVKLTKENRPFVSVVKDGKAVPESVKVMEVAARHNLVLETGHSSPAEGIILIREAKRLGVKMIVVTHALTNMGGPYTIPQMREAAQLGAYLEIVWGKADVIRASADAVKAVGARSFIVSSDLGQPGNPLHPDGLLEIYRGLAQQGISAADIELMSKTNPARVLGLEVN
jgi:hypothetical protein